MKLSEDVKKRILSAYPDSAEVKKCIETENYELLGQFLLAGAMNNAISVRTVLEAKSLEELKKLALILEEREKLYNIWKKKKEAEQNGGYFSMIMY